MDVATVVHEVQLPSGVAVLPARTFITIVVLTVVEAVQVMLPKLTVAP